MQGCGWDSGAARAHCHWLPVSPCVTRSAPMAWALRARAPVAAGSLPRATRSAPKAGALRARAPTCTPRNCARCLRGGVGMSKTSCAARCSRGSVQGRASDLTLQGCAPQCATFTGIGPEAESNQVTLRIKSGKIPKKTGISPDPAAESKVGYIPLFWRATVAWSRGARAPVGTLGQARALAMASTPARRFCATRSCTLYFLGLVP